MAGFITYWSKDYIKKLTKSNKNGNIKVVYGSPHHTRMPSIKGVKVGDAIYPVTIYDGNFYVVSKLLVEDIEPAYQYLLREVGVLHGALLPDDVILDESKLKEIPHEFHQIPITCCADLAATSSCGEVMRLRLISKEKIPFLKFGTTKSKQKNLRVDKNGVPTTVSLSGFVRRMSEETKEIFDEIFT